MAMGLSIHSTKSGGIPFLTLFSNSIKEPLFRIWGESRISCPKETDLEPRRFFSDFKELMNSKIV